MHTNIDRLVSDVRDAVCNGTGHAALALALALPDICAKAEGASHYDGGKGYREWVDEYVDLKFRGQRTGLLSGHVLYALRNAFLHSGFDDLSTYRHAEKLSVTKRIQLVDDTDEPRGAFYLADPPGGVGGALEISVQMLCAKITGGVEKWAEAVADNAAVQVNLDSLLTIRKPSPPYVPPKGVISVRERGDE